MLCMLALKYFLRTFRRDCNRETNKTRKKQKQSTRTNEPHEVRENTNTSTKTKAKSIKQLSYKLREISSQETPFLRFSNIFPEPHACLHQNTRCSSLPRAYTASGNGARAKGEGGRARKSRRDACNNLLQ